jgi:hypothetical protein
MEDVAIEDLTDSLSEECYDNDDDEDEDEDCERGLSRQPSFDTASLTLKSSSSAEMVSIEEDSFGSPTRLRRRQQSFLLPPHGNESSHDGGVDEDDDKKRFHEALEDASKQQHNLMRLLLISALVASSSYFLWSSKTRDIFDLSAKNRWKMPSKQQRKLVHKIQRQPLRDGVTIRLRGDRIDLMWQSIDRLARCPLVETIQIEWGHQIIEAVPEILLYHKSRKVTTPVGKTLTDAVFLLGESVHISCEDVERAYHEWMLDPVRLVGFLPLWDKDEGSYSLLSDHALLTHTLYLDSIDNTSSLQSESHCQHLAFSAYVTALSSKSPVAILSNLGRAAPSKYKSGSKQRECVKQLTEATGLHSLPETRTTYVGRQYSYV